MNGDETTTENQTPTAEEFQAVKAELETEKAKTTGLVEQATKPLQDKVASLETEVATKAGLVAGLEDQLARLSTDYEGARAAYTYAVEDFKKLILDTNPMFTPDLVWGSTVEEVKASVEKANTLVGRLKESLQAQAQAASVPAGAPARTGASTEGLSAKEKINLGLERAKKRKE
ncbi:MAG: hypothetical protein A2Z75_02420 [Chloroflexi bacterium RBG_13_50_10]|nr:MAG: hypothetical protein A2Z75_02420 [Chloroflexi bacterium RBG_13_50_10]